MTPTGKIFYISDLHLGTGDNNRTVVLWDQRPFSGTEEMQNEIIRRWNSVVSDADTVYVLGDFITGPLDDWLSVLTQLKGRIVLIRGNHDPKALPNEVLKYIEVGGCYAEIEDNGRLVTLCHYPILWYNGARQPERYMVYGHVHNSPDYVQLITCKRGIKFRSMRTDPSNLCQIYNCGCMMPWMGYTPRTLDELIQGENAWGKEARRASIKQNMKALLKIQTRTVIGEKNARNKNRKVQP